jgi:hypothetical protein
MEVSFLYAVNMDRNWCTAAAGASRVFAGLGCWQRRPDPATNHDDAAAHEQNSETDAHLSCERSILNVATLSVRGPKLPPNQGFTASQTVERKVRL